MRVATALLVAGPTLTFWIPGQTLFASTSSYSSLILYNVGSGVPICNDLGHSMLVGSLGYKSSLVHVHSIWQLNEISSSKINQCFYTAKRITAGKYT